MFYNFVKYILRFMLLFLVKLDFVNKEKIPQQGQIVFASNHVSLWDPVILGVYLTRKVHFIAKEELFKIFFLGFIMKRIGAIPIKRGQADRNAIRQSIKYLNNGEALCIFPEGTRSLNKNIGDFLPGTSLIAVKGNAPIIPVALIGTSDILKKGFKTKIRIVIGDPIEVNEYHNQKVPSSQIELLTKRLEDEVKSLFNE
ncbi:1-acyl-sn-glycerol-3-phosphate acyltransferase [Desulfonispora thiosulfatigenes DSM 11270]|uniref:1-acyl-sn-glycerol-3-phosphate acyltransferase n=1 Tax=Desulfonispora thiosulfatigenes DSM 11270 TaxID=656914 RepID=A0A1W1VM30_DESTI|nr:lysophospholipid acyltransferase family protein [Desulfonispora thiosulfatigenes]SMB94422.1 1-acyl-sn-glycerol-3-phosphate acyltransferase [Desulfonispora thiosulfatigenes DSM 11270]